MKRSINNVCEHLALCFVQCLVEEGFVGFGGCSGDAIVSFINSGDLLKNGSDETPYDIIEKRNDVFGGFELDFITTIINDYYEPSFFKDYVYVGALKKNV